MFCQMNVEFLQRPTAGRCVMLMVAASGRLMNIPSTGFPRCDSQMIRSIQPIASFERRSVTALRVPGSVRRRFSVVR